MTTRMITDCFSNAMTCSAPAPAPSLESIFRSKFMSCRTRGLSMKAPCALIVNGLRNGLQMMGIHAGSISTKMIYMFAFFKLSVMQFKRETMSQYSLFIAYIETPISREARVSFPFPTCVKWNKFYKVKKSFIRPLDIHVWSAS